MPIFLYILERVLAFKCKNFNLKWLCAFLYELFLRSFLNQKGAFYLFSLLVGIEGGFYFAKKDRRESGIGVLFY